MDTKILLEGFRSKKSSNTSEGLNVQLKGKKKLLPLDGVAEVISQYDQYTEEREACNKIRLTCQVNPICSNVLFNRITEVVKDEGSDEVSVINYGLNGRKDKKDDKLFDGIVYKKKEMKFWSGCTMNYQGSDEKLSTADPKSVTIFTATTSESYQDHSFAEVITCDDEINPITNSIRDTQLSNNTTRFVYHCGLDMFNNHLIRSNTFKTVCKMPKKYKSTEYTDEYSAFNTIADLMRDVSGHKVVEKISFPTDARVPNNGKLLALHLYNYDDLYTFDESVKNNLLVKYDGWVGFKNKSKIKSYGGYFEESQEMEIERPLMYLNGGDFVDMYPGRDLYSFLPKYNLHRQRVEKNWNYCLTYPSSSYTPSDESDDFADIIETADGLNSLKAIYFDENTRADNGVTQIVIYGIAKHGLSQGDYVNIYKTYEDEEGNVISEKVLENAEVNAVVDDYIFTVLNSTVKIGNNWVELSKKELKGEEEVKLIIDENKTKTYRLDIDSRAYFRDKEDADRINPKRYYIVNGRYVNFDDTAQRISYKKVVNGIECDYYIRIFSKIPNFKNASADTSSEYEIYKKDEEDKTLIEEYQKKEYDFENHISRLAFAKNIYSDNIGEVVFTDDIDISNLHDNLGRPLSSIFITFVKNNMGHKEWYGYDDPNWIESNVSASTVEYSHAFGPVKYGIKTSDESRFNNDINSINTITNIDKGYGIDKILNDKKPEEGESREHYINGDTNKVICIPSNEIWFNEDTNYYGDLCYYDNYNAVERHIDYIMHRFNTAQRESKEAGSAEYFKKFKYDEIAADDYDTSESFKIKAIEVGYKCNEKKEGYYYNPHYEIRIKTFDKLQTIFPDFLTIRQMKQVKGNVYQFTTLQQHYLTKGDKAVLYDSINDRYYNLVTVDGENDNYRVFTCMVYDEKTDKPIPIKNAEGNDIDLLSSSVRLEDMSMSDLKLFKMDNLGCPSYCRVLKDGTCRIIWRDILNNGFNKSDNSVEEYPYTNGAFYINKKIDIYVRRQDPHNFYGLFSEDETYIEGELTDISKQDNYVKDDEIEC